MNISEREKSFREAEASLRLEGLDPSGTEPYETIKLRILSGEITADEGHSALLAYHIPQNKIKPAPER